MRRTRVLWGSRILAYIGWGFSIISLLLLFITTIIGSGLAYVFYLIGALFFHLGVLFYYINIGNLIYLVSAGHQYRRERFFKVNILLIATLLLIKPFLPLNLLFNKISTMYGL